VNSELHPPFEPPSRHPSWNQGAQACPEECDVLVVGAGPAGSACARKLAQGGARVVLIDSQAFPREKVCGDGLVPDALAALESLGLADEVLKEALPASHARCVAPSGRHIDVPGFMAVLARKRLDAILCEGATQAGALMLAPAKYLAPLREASGRVCGAELEFSQSRVKVRARWVVLATGAAPAPLIATGLCERRTPSAVALRAYVRHPELGAEIQGLRFVWHKKIQGGYGWVFPGPDGVFNIGAGVLDGYEQDEVSGKALRTSRNLKAFFQDFLSADPVAQRLVMDGQWLGEIKGAPLRCNLDGAAWSAPGVLVCGEAAGTTYSFTGEGIGKAMETGIAAANCLLTHGLKTPGSDVDNEARVTTAYRAAIETLRPRYELYRKACSFNRHPWMIELMIWRARRSKRMINRLSNILHERSLPGALLSWRGLRAIIRG
jgi:geranylgeranyl reductase family protein